MHFFRKTNKSHPENQISRSIALFGKINTYFMFIKYKKQALGLLLLN